MSNRQKIIVLFVIGGLILTGGFLLLNSYIYQEKQTDEEVVDIQPEVSLEKELPEESSLDKIAEVTDGLSAEEREIRELLIPDKKYFIELVSTTTENVDRDGLYRKFLGRQSPLNFLGDKEMQTVLQTIDGTYNGFLHSYLGIVNKYEPESYTVTLSTFVGPFQNQEEANQQRLTIFSNFPAATVRNDVGSKNALHAAYRPTDRSILFPLRSLGVEGYEYVLDQETQKLFVLIVGGFEGERTPISLWIIDGKKSIITIIDGISGFVLLPNKQDILIARGEVFNPNPDSFSVEASLSKINLSTGKEVSLGLEGGEGGIYMLESGEIYIGNEFNLPFLKGSPFSRFDPEAETLITMEDTFELDLGSIEQPLFAQRSEEFEVIVGTEEIKLITFRERFYIQGKYQVE